MIGKTALGIIFANVHDEMVPELTEKRSMASIPFGSRYRLIDFSLSNLVNAGISKVGILTQENYRSLMDHLGSGKAWDLDRKNGGIFIMPPFSSSKYGISRGHVEALAGIMTFLKRSNEDYVVLCDADLISNIDLSDMIEFHERSGADVTVAYKNGQLPKNNKDIMILSLENETVASAKFEEKMPEAVDYSLDIFVIRRELLIEWIADASRRALESFSRDVIKPRICEKKIKGYKITDFAEVLDSADSYVRISRMLLNDEKRRQLFNREHPVYTKTRDDMPTRYGLNSVAQNSLIADGCLVEGTVKNSLLFRGVKVGKNAVVENCILMQGTVVGDNAVLSGVTADKGVVISSGTVLRGTEGNNLFIGKEKTI
ncbi:MAG: glucose-1-phosphate adenylyltransferase subunit GlgD [Clostridiales bacterium]|nr:glucose-1-phosphate adenylyltransferase subunit GlgD [Candidatus Equinaster intestinalis]